ncbi:MAG: hypothetical protein O7D27_12800 [Alphaproteobacteria bacterium]|nr:hypothetical protein [Alphaproteobacteria bacterium]
MTALAGAGELNRVVAWLRLASGAGTGLIMGLWSFDGPVAARAWIGNYGATSRRLLRLGHIAFFGLGIVKLLLVKNHPAAVLLRTKFDGSWDAARDAFKNRKLSKADMQMLFDFRKKVVDGLANEIKADPRIGGDWDACGSEKLTSDYDLSFSGPMAEVAVALFNARWAARWGDAVGIGGRESAYGADTNVYTKPVYNMFPGLRADVLAQDAFAYLATRKYANDAEWADFRKQVLNDNVRPEVRDRLKKLLDWAERTNSEFEKAIADKKEALSLEIYTGPGRPGMDLDAAAQNRLYEAALRDLIKLKDAYEAENSPAKRRKLAQRLRNAQAKALYFAFEAYQTNAAITHVVINTQAAKRPITAKMLLGEVPPDPLKVPMTKAEGRQSFFEQLANTLKEFNRAHNFETAPAESFNGLAGKVAKYFVRALDGARIGGVNLKRYGDLVKATIEIEANRGTPKELGDVIGERYTRDGAREFMRAVKKALGEMTQYLTGQERRDGAAAGDGHWARHHPVTALQG